MADGLPRIRHRLNCVQRIVRPIGVSDPVSALRISARQARGNLDVAMEYHLQIQV